MQGCCKLQVVQCSIVSFHVRSAEHCLKVTVLCPQNRRKVSDVCMHTCMPLFVFVKCALCSLDLRIYGSLSYSLSTCIPNHLPSPLPFLLLTPSSSYPISLAFPPLPALLLPIPTYSFSLTYLLSFSFLAFPHLLSFSPSPLPSSLFPLILLSPPPSPSPISYPPPSSPLSLFSPFLISPSVAYFYSGVKFVYAENLPTYKSVRRSFNKLMSLLENKQYVEHMTLPLTVAILPFTRRNLQ